MALKWPSMALYLKFGQFVNILYICYVDAVNVPLLQPTQAQVIDLE